MQTISTCIIRSLYLLSRTSDRTITILKTSNHFANVFSGIKLLGKPSQSLLQMYVNLAFDSEKQEIILPKVIINLVEWIKDIPELEQIFVCNLLSKICCQNLLW